MQIAAGVLCNVGIFFAGRFGVSLVASSKYRVDAMLGLVMVGAGAGVLFWLIVGMLASLKRLGPFNALTLVGLGFLNVGVALAAIVALFVLLHCLQGKARRSRDQPQVQGTSPKALQRPGHSPRDPAWLLGGMPSCFRQAAVGPPLSSIRYVYR